MFAIFRLKPISWLKYIFRLSNCIGTLTSNHCACNVIKIGDFPVKIAKFLRTSILKNICKQKHWSVSRKSGLNDLRPIIVDFSFIVISCTRSLMWHAVIIYLAKFLEILFSLPCLFSCVFTCVLFIHW